jgi:hypothetical protein
MQYGPLRAETAADLISRLQAIQGVTVIPMYANPSFHPPSSPKASSGTNGNGGVSSPSGARPFDSVMSCASLDAVRALGKCSPGTQAVLARVFGSVDSLFTDNPIYVYKALPLVTGRNPAATHRLDSLPLNALLVKASNEATLEQARTILTTFNSTISIGGPKGAGPGGDLSAWQMGSLEPQTFSEVAQIRNNDVDNLERVVLLIVGLTLLVAGCSLAVAVGGSLVERKRPFTLLRVSGTPASSLRGVVLLESLLPLLAASLVAAITGVVVARPLVEALVPRYAHVAYPGPIYYVTLGVGLLVSLGVILATLPLLARITRPDEVRFE